MQSFMVSLIGLVLSVSVGAEPLLKGRVWLASGPPAAGVHVRLFDLTDLRRSVGTTTDEAGHFALPLQMFSTDRRTALPQDFALGHNYPNPFNPSTIIPYQLPTATHVRLEVFNLLGQRLATLVDGERPAGAHTAHWDATDAAGQAVGAGVYIYRLTGGGHTVSRRMALIDGQAGIPAGAVGPGPRWASALERTGAEGAVYGLTVAGAGLIAYVDPAFRVGSAKVDVVLEQPGGPARMKVATGGILGDVNNDSQVDEFDVLYVALYSKDPSITLPNHGDISLGDVNGDDTVDLADALLLALYKVNPSDPTLPPGIGQPVGGSGDDHGDSPSAATALAVGGSRSGQLETGGDVDYFRVEVTASGELTVHTTGSLDTKGQLEDSAGAVLASDDDGGSGYNFRLAHAVSAGTYYIKVVGYSASATGSYTIHASGPGGGGSDDGTVNIADANLRAVIAEALGKAPNAPITPDEMATLTSLGAANKGIRNLAGLEFATNLTRLDLGVEQVDGRLVNSNDISNLSPLTGLTNLTGLWLEANSIADVSPLAGLTNLTGLWLYANNIADVSPLAGLTNLTGLWLYANSIADVSPLAGLTRLEIMSLGTNSIADVSPLAGLTNLTILRLYANSITDVSPLAGLTRLELLRLDANNISDVSPLSGLTRLESLSLKSNIISDVSPLSGLTNLTWLDLRGNPLSVSSINVHIAALVSRGTTVHFESFRQGDFDIELVYLDPFTESQKRVVEYAARRWMSIIPEDLQDIEFSRSFLNNECGDRSYDVFRGERIDDLRIYVSFLSNEAPDGIVGLAGPDIVSPIRSYRPLISCMQLDPRHLTTFRELVLHEMAHALGMVSGLWQVKGFRQRTRDGDWYFNGPRAIAAFNSAGGRNYAGPKVPTQGGAHWKYSVFLDELMVPFVSFGRLSAITIQSLADLDLGYRVDVTQADPYILPRARAAQTSAEIALNDSWDGLLKEGLGLYTQAEPDLLCGVGIVEEPEPLYLNEGEDFIFLGD
ncbi:MAG: T9SS type A sorting domain-containing protein [Gemmatimonadetes bacterium]|nr:T9SS type A sorting domain-containing protein [Gemmatimonadota bacterium]